MAELVERIAAYVRGEIVLDELYAWAAVNDRRQPPDFPEWNRRVAELWELLHQHYAEGRPEQEIRFELARALTPRSAHWSGAASTINIATTLRRFVGGFTAPLTYKQNWDPHVLNRVTV